MRSTTGRALDVHCARLPKMSTARGETESLQVSPPIKERNAEERRDINENHCKTRIDRCNLYAAQHDRGRGPEGSAGKDVLHHRRNGARSRPERAHAPGSGPPI